MASSWLLDVPAQQAFVSGLDVPPTVRQWEFFGPTIVYNTSTGRIEITAPAPDDASTILSVQVFS